MLVWRKLHRPTRSRFAFASGRRFGILAITAIVVALVSTLAAPSGSYAASDGYVDTDVLNLRDDAGTWGNVIDKMYQGEYVYVIDGPTDDGWYQVEYNGQVGWAYGSYLSIDGSSGWDDLPSGVGGYSGNAWVGTERLNLRTWASTSAGVIDVLGQGQEITVTGSEVDGFVPVVANGTSGWLYSGYLTWDGPVQAAAERWIDVDRSSQTVTLYEGDEAIASYWAALGYDHSDDGFFSTAVGTYYVYSKYAPVSWTPWGKVYIKYWVGFDPERSNGFHSYSLDAAGNVLANGDGPTGGCVATDLWQAETIYDFADIGTRVEVHN
jgi:uncharacterized protein YgiM (DUF1202 family)